jgi:hypothetical protein
MNDQDHSLSLSDHSLSLSDPDCSLVLSHLLVNFLKNLVSCQTSLSCKPNQLLYHELGYFTIFCFALKKKVVQNLILIPCLSKIASHEVFQLCKSSNLYS